VAVNEECRPVIMETLTFLYDLQMITKEDKEIPIPEIARPRIPHEILFVIGGWNENKIRHFIET
jgi:kelch-like protein 10